MQTCRWRGVAVVERGERPSSERRRRAAGSVAYCCWELNTKGARVIPWAGPAVALSWAKSISAILQFWGKGPSKLPQLKPPTGVVKITVDAVFKNELKASTAATIRDETGRFMGASALILRGPEVIESIAGREGMTLALTYE